MLAFPSKIFNLKLFFQSIDCISCDLWIYLNIFCVIICLSFEKEIEWDVNISLQIFNPTHHTNEGHLSLFIWDQKSGRIYMQTLLLYVWPTRYKE